MKKKTLKSKKTKVKLNAKHFFKRSKKKSTVKKKIDRRQLKFPNILRIITEKYFLASLTMFVLLVSISIVGINLHKDINQKQEIDKERQGIIKDVEFWKTVVSEHKDYRDAYFQLAILEYKLGDLRASKFYLDKVLVIDPNFEKGRELEKILNTK